MRAQSPCTTREGGDQYSNRRPDGPPLTCGGGHNPWLRLFLISRKAELGLLARSEQEVSQERHAGVLRVEPGNPRALRLVEHVAGAEHRLRLRVDLEHGGSVHDAADHQAGPGPFPDRPGRNIRPPAVVLAA